MAEIIYKKTRDTIGGPDCLEEDCRDTIGGRDYLEDNCRDTIGGKDYYKKTVGIPLVAEII